MPVVFDSLVHHHGLTPHQAWRVAFIVPFILIVATGIAMLTLGKDSPVGKWSERRLLVPGTTVIDESLIHAHPTHESPTVSDEKPKVQEQLTSDEEIQVGEIEVITDARAELIQAPTLREALPVIFSLQALTLTMTYFCSFGGELALNSILGAYYLKNFPKLGQTLSGRWASMYGLLNVITRPTGGFVGDIIYHYTHSLWLKKMWIHFVGISTGVFLIAIGLKNPHDQPTMFGLIAGMAFFHEAGNGANFALVPHVFPFANGKFSNTISAATV
jgi:NNP family nitrate/nitrite transporter-like MFS transporter